MLSNTRSTLAIAFAATILGASPALAMPAIDGDLRGGNAAALPEHAVSRPATGADLRGENAAARSATLTQPGIHSDLRGENAIGVMDTGTPPADDQRSPDTREPVGGHGVAQPVVVEVTDPDGSGFDWTAAIIGMAGGLALAVLAGVSVAGSRRRPTTV